jgi:hypothetical protein
LLLNVVADTAPQEAQDSFMNSRVYEKLFIHENHHILYGSQDFCLNTERTILLAQLDELPENIYQAR